MQRRDFATPTATSEPRRVSTVSYFDLTPGIEAPPLPAFACDALSATMTIKGCGKRWAEAQEAKGERGEAFGPCRACPIGASHAGRDAVAYSDLYEKPICPRCRRGTTRMIGGTRCVSCYNREREMARGRNSRGNPPAVLMRERNYRAVHLNVIVDGNVQRVVAPKAAHTLEPILQTMRTTRGDLAFAFAGPASELSQGRLL